MSAGTLKQAAVWSSADVSRVSEVHGRNEDSSDHVLSKAITCYQIESGRTDPVSGGVPAFAGRHKVARWCVPNFVRTRPIDAAHLTAEE